MGVQKRLGQTRQTHWGLLSDREGATDKEINRGGGKQARGGQTNRTPSEKQLVLNRRTLSGLLFRTKRVHHFTAAIADSVSARQCCCVASQRGLIRRQRGAIDVNGQKIKCFNGASIGREQSKTASRLRGAAGTEIWRRI